MTTITSTLPRYSVLAQTDGAGYLTAIASLPASYPLPEGWIAIDEGTGDRYQHAQNHYLSSALRSPEGVLRYILADGKPLLRPDLPDALAAARAAAARAAEIRRLKGKLAATDYAVIKIAEGAASVAEYASLLTDRATWRDSIRQLEGEAEA